MCCQHDEAANCGTNDHVMPRWIESNADTWFLEKETRDLKYILDMDTIKKLCKTAMYTITYSVFSFNNECYLNQRLVQVVD